MTDEVVARLYHILIEELQRRGHSEEEPIQVSELYQTLIPYRNVRSAIGVELNADYEHALLRLLAGERGLLRLDPPQAREELRREADSTYPVVGLFRKFSGSQVWVDMPPRTAGTAPPRPAESPVTDNGADNETEPARARARVREKEKGPSESPSPDEVPTPGEGGDGEHLPAAGTPCAFCGDDLPAGRRVRFCPGCGGDQRLQPCPNCEAVLERDWRYCISCGHEAGPA